MFAAHVRGQFEAEPDGFAGRLAGQGQGNPAEGDQEGAGGELGVHGGVPQHVHADTEEVFPVLHRPEGLRVGREGSAGGDHSK